MQATSSFRLFATVGVCFLCGFFVAAHASLSSKSSDKYPVEVFSTSAVAIEDALVVANQAIDLYLQTFKKDFSPDFKVTYFWNVKDMTSNKDAFDRSLVLSTSGPLEFKVYITGTPGTQSEAIARTTYIVLLQMEMMGAAPLNPGDKIKDPPFWFVEGLTQKYLLTHHEDAWKLLQDFQKIAARYAEIQRYPGLASIQSWQELSPHFLERKWQQAFCWKLLDAAIQKNVDRGELLSWIKKGEYDSGYWSDIVENKSWWDAQMKSPPKQQLPLLSFQETENRLSSTLRFSALLRGSDKLQNLSVQDLPLDPEVFASKESTLELRRKMELLRMISNFAWHPVLDAYSSAMTHWNSKKYKEYREQIAYAQSIHASQKRMMEKVNDRLDWFEINFPSVSTLSDMRPYREIFEEEKGQKSIIQQVIRKQTEVLK